MLINRKFIFSSTIILITFFAILSFVKNVFALDTGCNSVGQCVNNKKCIQVHNDATGQTSLLPVGEACGSSQIGKIEVPYGITHYNLIARTQGGSSGIGIVVFLSNLVQVFVIVAGIIAMFNFALAGYIFITSGSDPAAVGKVREKLTWTVIGLVFIVASYIAAGLIGLLFFDDASFILQPKLFSVLDQPQP